MGLSDNLGEYAIGFAGGGGGFEGETGSPETVGMAILTALPLKTDVAAGGDGLADGTEIGGQEAVVRDADGPVLEGATEFVGELFFQIGGEGETFDAVAVELFPGAFDELTAQAGLVNAGSSAWHGQEGIEHGFLGFEGLLFEAYNFAGVMRRVPNFSTTQITVRSWKRPMSTPM
jgi:hypothetical protein